MAKLRLEKFLPYLQAVFFAALAGLPHWAFAQTAEELNRCDNFKNQFGGVFKAVPSAYCSASGLLLMAINILLTFAGVVTVLFLIVGGFWYIAAAGNEETLEKGRKTLINSLVGLIVIILSAAIVRIIAGLLTLGK